MGQAGQAEIDRRGDIAEAQADERSAGLRETPSILRFCPAPSREPVEGRLDVVLDTTWAAPADDPEIGATVGLREVAERLLGGRDLIAETSTLLDEWADRAGVVEATTVDGTSFWYYGRLDHWLWLQERILWLGIVDALVGDGSFARIECAAGTDPSLVEAARAIAARDGLDVEAEDTGAQVAIESTDRTDAASPPAASSDGPAAASSDGSAAARSGPVSPLRRLAGRLRRRLSGGVPTGSPEGRRRLLRERLATLADEPDGRLLVLLQHARQRVDGPSGSRLMNAYLGPIVDRLRGTRLEPIELDLRARLRDDATWLRMTEPGEERYLPAEAIWSAGATDDQAAATEQAGAAAERIAATSVPVLVSGVDLGPALAGRVSAFVRRSLPGQIVNQARARHLIRRLAPAGILLADEYHRQEWLGAARLEGISANAVQHGLIYDHHNGYIHRDRPAALRIPDRLYVFGDWERRLLVDRSVFHADEVSVGGSPRLDLVAADAGSIAPADRESLRTELGVRPGDRMVVLSGTWGSLYRRFHYPIALAGLVDRPLPRVHIVVKLHPGEEDEGPYRAVIDHVAAARGFAPPPVTVIREIDLYRLLRSADAHLGVHSTVLTEAVFTGTPNLLAAGLAGADLLGYVEAGVATPVVSGADLLAALDAPGGGAPDASSRRAFLDDHFRLGSASQRIADDLLERLP